MTVELAVVLVIGALSASLIVAPLFGKEAQSRERTSETLSRTRELESQRNMLLASLSDLENDYATHKVDEDDYHELHKKLSDEAVLVLRELDEMEANRERALEAELRFSGSNRPRGASEPDR